MKNVIFLCAEWWWTNGTPGSLGIFSSSLRHAQVVGISRNHCQQKIGRTSSALSLSHRREKNVWLSPSRRQRGNNSVSGFPPKCQDLSASHDWSIKKATFYLPIGSRILPRSKKRKINKRKKKLNVFRNNGSFTCFFVDYKHHSRRASEELQLTSIKNKIIALPFLYIAVSSLGVHVEELLKWKLKATWSCHG